MGTLASEGAVCAVGAFVAHKRAQREGVDLKAAIERLSEEYEFDGDAFETADEGAREGLAFCVAWHFGYLNDEHFYAATPEERFDRMLAWVRRAQGKEVAA
jgi:hypothetical protein